jgi:hypothetical protein
MKKYKEFVLLIAIGLAVFGCADTGKEDISTPNNSNTPTELTNGEIKQVVLPAPSHAPFTQEDFEQFVAQWQAWHDQVQQPTFYRYTAVVGKIGNEPEIREWTGIMVWFEKEGIISWGEFNTGNRNWNAPCNYYGYETMGDHVQPDGNSNQGASGVYGSIARLLQSTPWEDVLIEYDPVYHYPKYAQLGDLVIEIRDFWIAQISVDELLYVGDPPITAPRYLEWYLEMQDSLFPPGYCPYPAGTTGVTLNGEPYQP